jgi:hypothetical protein
VLARTAIGLAGGRRLIVDSALPELAAGLYDA